VDALNCAYQPGARTCFFSQKTSSASFEFLNVDASGCITGRSQWPPVLRHATVFAHSNSGIMGSNPTQAMNVCVRLFCVCVVLCVGSGLATG
jgi:hypothetical protein